MPPEIDIVEVVESSPRFEFVMRITCETINEMSLADFEKLVLHQVVLSGKPLVVEGFQSYMDSHVFSEKWLREKYSSKCKSSLYSFFARS